MLRDTGPSDRVIAETAWLYYVKNLTQGEIAAKMGLSRPTVISYIKQAKAREIVCVRLSGEHFRLNAMADALTERFRLESAHVIPVEGLSEDGSLLEVCQAAAHVLLEFVSPGDQLGVSWGKTLSFISDYVPYWPIENLTVRQLIGSMANPLLPTSERCSIEIANRVGALCINLNAPAICSSVLLADLLKAEPIVQDQLEMLKQCNKAIYTVSPATPDSHVTHFKIASQRDIENYMERGAAGIIAGRFIDAQGEPVLGEIDTRLIGADHATLRQMDGMLVVSGQHKLAATRAALRGGFAQKLVVDADLAQSLLDT
ncbi:sugar-binding transcriptional regulator [Gluconobacter kanchanaburiensis]|uniref:DeoR family transcriptional regulator n=1 Tax=Gluconobacter kanchanaburiensis NBRC 103587 TaxID=1307948 RepID=A0A511B7L6_9PROT|nr:sugar-binding domain-containing protein [Gluconobacter kanchanaburiensis]MBF0862433.1 sugar-binding transcriptional regulator [Gluconobacter kanchanaburiensis]GBR68653.1 DeoR family transcriptional regulator [Gluconobacter kanchanaburiensis NBRC 103587]GEK96445.1 DeoR family transcriptional regulator [Gluconobacter kanchanaburiensis NBRC 103587]